MPGKALPPPGTALLLALVAALLLFRLGATPLLGPDEPRYARVAVEMRRGGDLVTPTLQGRPWLEKPALYYWLAGACYSLLGESEAAARLPSVAAGVALVGATALVGARLFGASAGLHAGFVLGTSVLFFAYGRAAAMDMLLAAAVSVAIGLFGLRLLGLAGPLAVPAAWAAMGVAALAKGPIGALLPALVVLGQVAATRDWRGGLRLLTPLGLAAFALVAAPWYLLVYRAQGQAFVDVFLFDHNLRRFTSTIHRHPGPFYYYLPVLFAGLFPWSGLLIPGLAELRPRRFRPDLFVMLWLVLPLGFLSLAGSKLPGYAIPCLPPLALLAARAAVRLAASQDDDEPWRWSRLVALVGLVLGALVVALPLALRAQGEPRWLDALPSAVWTLIVTFTISRRLGRAPAATLAMWRVGAAGLLLLVASGAPGLLGARESGRAFFVPAQGREVLAFGAWRTAWMAGYFYNDGRVREVSGLGEVEAAVAERGSALVLCGPAERRRLQSHPGLAALTLVEGPRRNALLRVDGRPGE